MEMIRLNKNTKKAQGFIWAYNRAKEQGITDIFKAYKNPSDAKVDSFEEIMQRCWDSRGEALYVISSGCQFYSTGYKWGKDLVVDTYAATYWIRDVFE